MPIGAWAAAVWDGWMPVIPMARLIQFAKAKVLRAIRPWSVVYGPAAAFVATCERLGWKVISETTVETDQGRVIDMLLDPPKVVELEVDAAVRRWRWRRIARHAGHSDF